MLSEGQMYMRSRVAISSAARQTLLGAALQGGRLICVSSAVVQKTLSAKPLSTGEE